MPLDLFLNRGGVIHAARVNRVIVVVLVDHDDVAVIKLRVVLAVLHGSWRLSATVLGGDLDDFGRRAGYGTCYLACGDRLLPDVNVATVLILDLCPYQAKVHRFLLTVGAEGRGFGLL